MDSPAPRPPRRPPRLDWARAQTLIGGGVAAGAAAGLLRGGLWATLSAPFGAAGILLAIDGWVYRKRGEAFLISHPGRFALTAFWSVAFWGFFEVLNFRLNNWQCPSDPANPILRWTLTLITFATVVPLVLELADLLDTAGFLKSVSVSPFHRSGRLLFPALGVVCLALPLVWPDPFFPLVWGAPFFLLEPVAEALGAPSLLSDWKSGGARRAALLGAAGVIAGLLWQCWNVGAGARWVFTIPHLDHWKILNMPALAYLAFVPFAFSAHAVGAVASRLWDRSGLFARLLWGTAWIVWTGIVLLGMDRFTRIP